MPFFQTTSRDDRRLKPGETICLASRPQPAEGQCALFRFISSSVRRFSSRSVARAQRFTLAEGPPASRTNHPPKRNINATKSITGIQMRPSDARKNPKRANALARGAESNVSGTKQTVCGYETGPLKWNEEGATEGYEAGGGGREARRQQPEARGQQWDPEAIIQQLGEECQWSQVLIRLMEARHHRDEARRQRDEARRQGYKEALSRAYGVTRGYSAKS
ncbi:uncharacterized protein BXZ73DRAFT_73223 [Epithele typhae]|uniref:uncharacterized protein n=1 Tax=Epithele typhae TaxID=378194 RepID=UPI002007E5FB|nr:uncharacterized protein BXZ73DRAFT_73223 [Epithele typhae]KAH9944992.1 hypothetical protein BXZ73DRAFT_73223 [Epithele typhae]